MIVGGASPQAHDVGAVFLDQVGGVNAVAQRLVHGASLTVHRPAVGQNLLEGCAVSQRADGGQKAGLEPASVLVGAFQIDVGRPQLGSVLHEGGVVGGAGVKPAVQSVGLLVEGFAAAMGAAQPFGNQLHGVLLKPDVGAVFVEQLREVGDGLVGADGLAAVPAVEHGDGQTPAALTGNAPVGTLPDHADHPLAAPGGQPLHILAGGDGLVLEGLHRAEPLRGCPEDDGLLAAVVVGVGVDDLLGGEQSAAFLHVRENDGVAFLGLHTGVLAGVVGVASVVVHGDDQIHAVAHAGLVVVGTEAGGGVDTARTGIHGDVLGVHQTGGLVDEGMLCQHILKELAGVGGDDLVMLEAADVHDLVHQGFRHDIGLAVVGLVQNIGLSGVQADGKVAGQRPDGGRPDDEVGAAQVEACQLAQIVLHGELDVDGGAGIVVVLDLGLGHGGGAHGAPVHGLQALVDIALVEHPAKDFDLLRFKVLVHGAVGVLPVAHNAQTLEARHLALDIGFGEFLAGGAELGNGHGLVVELALFDDGGLNGQTVIVPAGNVGSVIAHHGVAADDEVLQGLIQGVTHVDVAVAEGRAVMQHEGGEILVLFQHSLVEVLLLPAAEHTRLPGGQTRLHGEIGFRCDDRVFIIHRNTYLQK